MYLISVSQRKDGLHANDDSQCTNEYLLRYVTRWLINHVNLTCSNLTCSNFPIVSVYTEMIEECKKENTSYFLGDPSNRTTAFHRENLHDF
jgi:hypothetical protein